ncbi:hypothetical protein NVP1101O_197 [Vibrio phage 1.101.O._10N.261.45.C6]|nr:hypothetical protein NVP1101O_197 [Vibrio phage 1.101.O._10N.261.45.C6]
MTDKFELTMDTNSVHKWDIPAAIRDFVQNMLDNSNGYQWGYNEETETLSLTNYNTQLDRKVWLHGYSEKQGDNSTRGCHGDGLKSSVAVLLREGCGITIYNGSLLWKPQRGYSETFQSDVVIVTEEENNVSWSDYTVEITGITSFTMNQVILNTLDFQDNVGQTYETEKATILFDESQKGKVYCGGLFVGNFKSEYGFDFKPEHLELDRDRKSFDPFNVKWKCQDVWREYSGQDTEESSEVVISNLKNCEGSSEFLKYQNLSSENLNKAAEKVYTEEYSGKLVTSSYDEFNELKAAGNQVELVKSEGLVNLIRKTESYQVVFEGKLSKKTPSELLEAFKDKWYDEFSSEMLYDFEDMQSEIEK